MRATVGHVFAYFTGEGVGGQAVRLAVSSGSEPVAWEAVGGGRAIIESRVGERGMRDPFLIRDDRRDRFVLLATDLHVATDADWERAVRRGSRSIVISESCDLIDWSEPRLLEVAPQEAGNAWAPKAFWSPEDDAWLLLWASTLYPGPSEADRSTARHQRVLCATTSDFRQLSPVSTYLDPGHPVIDLTFLVEADAVYRFSKQDAPNGSDQPSRHITLERGRSLRDPNFVLVDHHLGRGDMEYGEGPAVARSLDSDRRYLLIDEFGRRGYLLFATDRLGLDPWSQVAEARLPAGARHGSVIEVTAEELDRLQATRRDA